MACINRPYYPFEGLSSRNKDCKCLYLKRKGSPTRGHCYRPVFSGTEISSMLHKVCMIYIYIYIQYVTWSMCIYMYIYVYTRTYILHVTYWKFVCTVYIYTHTHTEFQYVTWSVYIYIYIYIYIHTHISYILYVTCWKLLSLRVRVLNSGRGLETPYS
jgi:hypothetical protein